MGFRRPVTVERQNVGQVGDDGYYTPSAITTMTIFASVQPLNTKEYTQLGIDGERNVRYVKAYTKTRLYAVRANGWKPAAHDGQFQADVIIWQGSRYKVIQCDPYQSGVISHYKAIAQEVTAHDE
nr:MAG TPA: Minor capsid protein [Caudoviricetes sp.]